MAKKKKRDEDEGPKVKTMYTISLDDEQMEKLRAYLDHHLWAFFDVQYARFAFRHTIKKVVVTAYNSGKVVIAGKGMEDFVRDVLEAEITGDPRLGYDEVHHPDWYEPHAGMDEAGKGDLFGPLVVATVIADGNMVRQWKEEGIQDSKKMTDPSVERLDKIIRKTKGVVFETAYCSMSRYNELMAKPRANLNKLLAWLHAQALTKALEKKHVPWGLLDQFSKKDLVGEYFKQDDFELRQRTKAESDPVVAAAAIIARATFVREMRKLSKQFGEELRKGASAQVKAQATKLVAEQGDAALGKFAKLHFKTAYEARGLKPPPKPPWSKY